MIASTTRQLLFDRLADLGIATTTTEHAAVFTVAESDILHRTIPGGHIKNLFLKDKKGRLFLVVALQSTPIHLKSLEKRINSDRLSFAKPELLREVLGVEPGSVTPFALINDRLGRVEAILDSLLLRHDLLNCHPLENTATTTIARDDLLRFIRSCGHELRVIDLPAPPARDTTAATADQPTSGDDA
jgi:Ala-tRNA(Pro) deacylase